jgi:hypothetical protein
MTRTHLLLALLLLAPATLGAQTPIPSAADTARGWDDPRALELVQRAERRRTESITDTALVSYRADARAFVYFYLDREDTGERNLVRTDQVALEVLWHAPDLAKQRIVGWRDQKSLPTNIHYHIDHLAVVMENFGNEIRIGDGDEVRDVPHPAAPGADTVYQYRLADSLTLRLPGAAEAVRVYQLEVRPRDLKRPAFIGSIFVDQRAGDLVRMDFTFTPASYRDRRLDYINISLDNGLWKGRFWLPNEQRVELRRQIPELDFPVGSVIRGTMRVSNYRFNDSIPLGAFLGPPVVLAPAEQRKNFPFEEGIHAGLREEGIGPEAELGAIRREAMRLARQQLLSGLTGTRLRLPSASEVLRYNRAEGLALGAGVSRLVAPATTARMTAGWAFGPQHPLLGASVQWRPPPYSLEARGYINTPRDVGVTPAASGVANTLAAFFAGRDYTDLFYASGAEAALGWRPAPGWQLTLGGRAELQRSASREADFSLFGGEHSFRPVHPIDEGYELSGALDVRKEAPWGVARWWRGSVEARAGALQRRKAPLGSANNPALGFVRVEGEAAAGRRWEPRASELELTARAGALGGRIPLQQIFLLGGRGTIPGYSFRSFAGDAYATAGAVFSADLASPWLRGRLRADAGTVGRLTDRGAATAERWDPFSRTGTRASVGAGLGLFHDVVYLDLTRGLASDGKWEVILEARRDFWNIL